MARAWIWDAARSSAKTKVFGAEVAREIRSAAALGDEADFVSARKGFGGKCQFDVQDWQSLRRTARAFNALVCSILSSVEGSSPVRGSLLF